MRQYLVDNKTLFIALAIIIVSIFTMPAPVKMGVYLLFLLLFLLKNRIGNFLLLYILLLTLSDSFSPLLQFSGQIKSIGTLMLPIIYLKNRDFDFGKHFIWSFIPFLIIMIFMLVFAYDFLPVFQRTLSYGITIVFLPMLAIRVIKTEKEFLLNLFVLMNVLLFLGILLKYINPPFVTRGGRFRGMFGNPNGLGIYIVIVFSFYFALKETGHLLISRWWKIFFFTILLISLFWCSSRAAMMAVIICFAFSYIYSFSTFIGWISFAVIMFFYDEVLNLIPTVTQLFGMGRSLRADDVDEIKEGSGRLIAWQFAWWAIKKNMLLGGGMGYTNVLFVEYKDWLSIRGHQGNAHSAYFTLWLDTGLFGMLSYFIGLIASVVKVSGRFKFITPILFSILFSNYYESWLAASLNPYTPVYFIIIAVYYAKFSDTEIETEELETIEKEMLT
jgi:hypothetical protein